MLVITANRVVAFLDFFRCLAMWLSVCFLSLSPLSHPQRQRKKLLVIRLDAIGDFALWLDAAKELRRLYPPENFEITLLGNSLWSPLAEKLPWFDSVWPLERKLYLLNPLYFFKLLLKIRDASFDIVINPTLSREFKVCDTLVKASQAPLRIGSRGDLDRIRPWQQRISDRWYSSLLPTKNNQLMELERNAEFIRELGNENFRAACPVLPQVSKLPYGFSVCDYVVLIPGAGTPSKQWPTQRFKEVAERIYQRTGWTSVICGGKNDEQLGKEVLEGNTMPAENWCNRTSLPELAAILAAAHLVIANDTGAVHIAAALSVPVACVLGGGHPGRFLPYRIEIPTERPLPVPVIADMDCFGCDWRHCRVAAQSKAAAPCIENISVDQVWDTISRILEQLPTVRGQHG